METALGSFNFIFFGPQRQFWHALLHLIFFPKGNSDDYFCIDYYAAFVGCDLLLTRSSSFLKSYNILTRRKDSSKTRLLQLLKKARFTILRNIVPSEISPVHGYINAAGQCLDERDCASEVKQPIRAAEFVGDHRAREYDRFVLDGLA